MDKNRLLREAILTKYLEFKSLVGAGQVTRQTALIGAVLSQFWLAIQHGDPLSASVMLAGQLCLNVLANRVQVTDDIELAQLDEELQRNAELCVQINHLLTELNLAHGLTDDDRDWLWQLREDDRQWMVKQFAQLRLIFS